MSFTTGATLAAEVFFRIAGRLSLAQIGPYLNRAMNVIEFGGSYDWDVIQVLPQAVPYGGILTLPNVVDVGKPIYFGNLILTTMTGTATVTNGSPTVTWASGDFFMKLPVQTNMSITLGGVGYTILTVNDAFSITLTGNYAGASSPPDVPFIISAVMLGGSPIIRRVADQIFTPMPPTPLDTGGVVEWQSWYLAANTTPPASYRAIFEPFVQLNPDVLMIYHAVPTVLDQTGGTHVPWQDQWMDDLLCDFAEMEIKRILNDTGWMELEKRCQSRLVEAIKRYTSAREVPGLITMPPPEAAGRG